MDEATEYIVPSDTLTKDRTWKRVRLRGAQKLRFGADQAIPKQLDGRREQVPCVSISPDNEHETGVWPLDSVDSSS